ncbi:N-formylglutamate amidohydrolase [Hyphococcus flavus]|uniref:N-formylglutamate amidohydrolase n=1 Tax=Hyphococcus flavus TaxID=1866326 RepID=A0AAF0CEI3_9PROT|nr:N-formylglutamate amidohydrolase [Hyphococcus flavus]WDI31316.1 N-formylglutamate amidohydrolase [Hyphococcus flavus]
MNSVFSTQSFGDSRFFVFCDHASNAISYHLNALGLPEDLLDTHIAWDIGAGALSKALAKKLSATQFQCEFSRLIIDPNRAPSASDIIPASSDHIPIPGNREITEASRAARLKDFHEPYHAALGDGLDQITKRCNTPFVISVHSFTERLMGAEERRPWKIGLLWRDDEESARAMMRQLKADTGWSIGDNEPYDARVFNYSIDRHVSPRNLPHLTMEIRQDLIGDSRGVQEIAAIIEHAVRTITA